MNQLKGKEFEALVLFRANHMESAGILTMTRYGVQAVMMNSKLPPYKPEWQVIKSLPDFDACIAPSGRQLIVECKVCSQASYPIFQNDKKHPKQIAHMMKRSEFGALCYLLVHFNARDLVKKSEAAETFGLRVAATEPFWVNQLNAAKLSLSRLDAEMYGIRVPWNLYSPRASKLTPDLSVLI